VVILEGFGLHGGKPAKVTLRAARGPTHFVHAGEAHALPQFVPSGERRSTELVSPAFSVRTVEHLFAALAGLRLFEGVSVEVVGDELPLLDGGARAFAEALASLGVAPRPPRLRVARDATLEHGRTRMRFEVADETYVAVVIDFGDARLAPHAEWRGETDDFVERIAPARTFGFGHEVLELADRGLASHVPPESVVLVTDETILSAGRPPESDEAACHKLLDLLGDSFFWGGPPVGRVVCEIPGHASSHALFARALAEGILVGTRA
jgi:UDP-3-O-acyl-N-acetylglucosamine deacetylase